jgi:hypothetical protein
MNTKIIIIVIITLLRSRIIGGRVGKLALLYEIITLNKEYKNGTKNS